MNRSNFILSLLFKGEVPSLYKAAWNNSITQTKIEAVLSPIPPGTQRFRVTNIPSYFELAANPDCSLVHKQVSLYDGYALDLSKAKDEKDYMAGQLSKRNRKNLFSKKKKLERTGDISYRIHYGETLGQEEYNAIFKEFYQLLKNRFRQKKMWNRDLSRWEALTRTVFPLILKKKASLFVVYDGERMINITLNFHVDQLVFSHIQTFDTTYGSLNLPDISMLKQLEWCFANGVQLYDLMIGHTYYKEKWGNTAYCYQEHIFFNPNPLNTLYAHLLIGLLKVRSFARKRLVPPGISTDHLLYLLRKGAGDPAW